MKLKTITKTVLLICTCHLSHAEGVLIKNGDFSAKGIKPWKVFALKDVTKPTFKVTSGVITIVSAQESEKFASEQLSQSLDGMKSETKYKLTFDAKAADTESELLVTLARSKDWSKGHYGMFKKLKLTKEWQAHSIHFKTKQLDEGNAPNLKLLFGLLKGEFSFRNVKLAEVKQ